MSNWAVEHRPDKTSGHELDHVVLMGGEVVALFAFPEDARLFADAAEDRPARNYSTDEECSWGGIKATRELLGQPAFGEDVIR